MFAGATLDLTERARRIRLLTGFGKYSERCDTLVALSRQMAGRLA